MTSARYVNLNIVTFILILVYLLKSYKISLEKKTKIFLGYHRDSLLNFTELSSQYGYQTEEHDVVTEDGYILTVFHIKNSGNCQNTVKRNPVLLIHGLIESADLFLDAGPESGLAYLLPDACFDLWVGNQRGNYYGRRHTHLDPDMDAEFWEFTAEEMANYDIPSMIDYILNKTNSEKLNFIGYSQGGANFFIMCSDRPDYCQKTRLMIALAPSAILSNIQSRPLIILAKAVLITKPLLELFGVNELLNKGGFVQELLEYFCQYTGTSITDKICGTGGFFFDNFHPGSISYETQRTLFGHFPAGTSVKNLARLGQIFNAGKFQKYDYGLDRNLKRYGSVEPPEFNLSAVTVPVVIVHGKNDILTVTKDIKSLEYHLPNVVDAVEIADPLWTHFDIVYSQYSQNNIFSVVKKYLDKYSDTF